jgi:hypothetical protein
MRARDLTAVVADHRQGVEAVNRDVEAEQGVTPCWRTMNSNTASSGADGSLQNDAAPR